MRHALRVSPDKLVIEHMQSRFGLRIVIQIVRLQF